MNSVRYLEFIIFQESLHSDNLDIFLENVEYHLFLDKHYVRL